MRQLLRKDFNLLFKFLERLPVPAQLAVVNPAVPVYKHRLRDGLYPVGLPRIAGNIQENRDGDALAGKKVLESGGITPGY